jgi:hypothetical protein
MHTYIRRAWLPLLFLLAAFGISSLRAQQFSPTEDLNMTPEKASELLKTHWTFLRDATEDLFKRVDKRAEFETSEEFTRRVVKEKQTYNAKIDEHIKDTKLNRRMFGVLLKANLKEYDANTGVYALTCDGRVEAPYDIPVLVCSVPSNPYVSLADTTAGGYRLSKLYLKFTPDFKWTVSRTVAMDAKHSDPNMFFKLRFVLDVSQHEITDKAVIRIIPVDIQLVDQAKRLQYWVRTLR